MIPKEAYLGAAVVVLPIQEAVVVVAVQAEAEANLPNPGLHAVLLDLGRNRFLPALVLVLKDVLCQDHDQGPDLH